jgi:hypothetical protein
MFTRQGYLWDVPIKWKHIDLKDLSQGKIPADCDLLLLPSESFMSGTIDSKCVEKIKEWVKKGHSLWVLRAAGYADIYGKDKKFTSLREITGIDYKKKDAANDLSKSVVKTAKGRSHEITSGLPEKSFLDIDRKWLVEFSHCKYDWWNSYYPTHPTEWFLGTQPSKYMIKQLLPSYYEYNGSGAVDFDNSCEILLKQGDAPFLAVKEFGKGKVAYLGREYNLSSDFGHMLLSKTAYWLMGKKANIECDNYNIDIALRKAADASFLILEYNPLEKQSAKGNIKIRNLDPQSKYIILNEKFPEFPGFLKSSKNKSIWTASEIEKKGYNIDLDSWQLGIQHLVPYKTKHLVFEHAFIDPSEGIEGSVSSFVKIKSFSKLSKGQYRLELISEEKSPLLVLPQNELRVSIAPEYSFSIYCDNERIGDFKSGKVLSSKEPVHFSYDSSKNLLSLKF